MEKLSKKEILRVAFCGTRGIPANYGGFETAVEEITKRFTEKGVICNVFCRSENKDVEKEQEHQGRKLIFIAGSKYRKLDTFVSSINTGLYLIKNKSSFDYIFWFNNANMPGILISLFCGIPMSINTDGLEWRRAKWSWPFKLYYFISSTIISLLCKNLISDSKAIQHYYKKIFKRGAHFIPYGSPTKIDFNDNEKKRVLDKYNIQENKYFLQITRFEPDNLPLEIIKSFKKSNLHEKGIKLVLIGYKDSTPYADQIMQHNNTDGVIVLKANYNSEELAILRSFALAYVHGNSVGGTNPALLEAMRYCKRIIAIKGPFSKEVLGENGLLFTKENLHELLIESLNMEDQSLDMNTRLDNQYQWPAVADSYLNLMKYQSTDYNNSIKNINVEQKMIL